MLTMERAEFSSMTTDQAWEVIGTEGTLHLPMQRPREGPNAVILDRFIPGEGVVSEAIWEAEQDSYSGEGILENFVEAVHQDKPPKTTLEQALIMQKITDAIYTSAETGAAVSIS